ncbi:MAG: hypothetical protein ACU84Q_12330 [Gammaproteobacteria bacterium]
MLAIARLAMKGPFAASASATIYALLALAFAPFLVISGAIVSLSGLRHGDTAAFKVAFLAATITGAIVYFLADGSALGLVLFATLLPLVALSSNLRRTHNQGMSLTLAAMFAFGYAWYMRVRIGDVDRYWLERLNSFSEAVTAQGGTFLQPKELTQIASMMHESTILLAMMFFCLSLLLARWWQASIYNPGGFGTEFRQLILPKALMLAAAVTAIGYLMTLGSGLELTLVGDALVLVISLFVFQGLAVVHHRAKIREIGNGLFIFGYIFLVFLPHIVGVMLAFLGIVDNVVDFRKLRGRAA